MVQTHADSCMNVYLDWGRELGKALWPLPEEDPDMVPTQKEPGPTQQH